jgi:hypothetical protein
MKNLPEPIGHSKGSPKRKVYSHECIYKKDRKISNKRPNATSQTPRKIRTTKSKTSRREIIKIRTKINEIETKKPYKESMKQKAAFVKK